jgi:hypothetical protein
MKWVMCLALMCGVAGAQAPARLVWSDEFDRAGCLMAKWAYQTGGHGWGNQEKQYYTEGRAENARVENGRSADHRAARGVRGARVHLGALGDGGTADVALRLLRDSREAALRAGDMAGDLDAGRGVARGTGRPWGRSTSWSMSATTRGACTPRCIAAAYNHTKGTQKGGFLQAPGMRARISMCMRWTGRRRLEFYLDGRRYFRFANEGKTRAEWPFDQPFYLLLNVAVGGIVGRAEGGG